MPTILLSTLPPYCSLSFPYICCIFSSPLCRKKNNDYGAVTANIYIPCVCTATTLLVITSFSVVTWRSKGFFTYKCKVFVRLLDYCGYYEYIIVRWCYCRITNLPFNRNVPLIWKTEYFIHTCNFCPRNYFASHHVLCSYLSACKSIWFEIE